MSSLIDKLTALLVLFFAVVPAYATVYTVGDSAGWTTNMNYGNWINGKSFYIGDSLYFSYSGLHSVNEVNQNEYNSCSLSNTLQSYNDGSTTIPLNQPGTRYFVCANHCNGGMKLSVTTYSGNANGNGNGNYNPNGNGNGNGNYNPNGNGNYPNNGNGNYQNPSAKNVANGAIVGASALVALALMG